MLLTADEGVRGGRAIPLRQTCGEAIDMLPENFLNAVITQRRTGNFEHVCNPLSLSRSLSLKQSTPLNSVLAHLTDPLFAIFYLFFLITIKTVVVVSIVLNDLI